MTNGIHFQMVVMSTCLDNMYHYRYQRRTPNTQIRLLPAWVAIVTDAHAIASGRLPSASFDRPGGLEVTL